MPIASRLTNAGTLLVNGIFDEVTSIAPAKFRTTANTVYAGTLDEVTGMVATNGLLLYVNGSSGVYSGSGTQWTDLSTYNNNATLTNSPTYSSTTGRGSFNFNGTSQFASVTPALLNTTYTGKTVFVVCRMSSAGWTPGVAQYRAMFGTGTGTRNFNFYVYHTAANTYQLHFSVSGSATITTDVAIVPDTWMILAVTQDTTVTYYVNGVSVYSANGQTLSQYVAGGNEAVARADNYWSGDIAVCSIYSRTLSSAEILNNYNAFASIVGLTTSTISDRQNSDGTLNVNTQFDEFTGAPVVDTSLQLWLDSGQTASYPGTGATWTDLSGNGNNGTLTNTQNYSTTYGGQFAYPVTPSTTSGTEPWTRLPDSLMNNRAAGTISVWLQYAAVTRIGNYHDDFGQALTGRQIDGTGTWAVLSVSGFVNSGGGPVLGTTGKIYWHPRNGIVPANSTANLAYNTIYNVVMTFNSSQCQFYINGSLDSTTSGDYSVSASAAAINGFSQGVWLYGGEYYMPWSGFIYQTMIYNRALTADEITTNFNALRGRYGI